MSGAGHRSAIRGLVLPLEWDKGSQVRAVGIFAANEHVYRVREEGRGPELLQHLQEEVVARGEVINHPAGRRSIRVVDYQLQGRDEPKSGVDSGRGTRL